MSTDELFFDGVRHLSASDAALLHHFTSDYVARLCREGKLRAKRVGKNWFVDENSLRTFVADQEYKESQRQNELVRQRKVEYQKRRTDEAPHPITTIVSTAVAKKNLAAHSFNSAPLYAIHPAMDLAHRILALIMAIALVVGTFAFADPRATQSFFADAQQSSHAAMESLSHISPSHISVLLRATGNKFGTVSHNPGQAAAVSLAATTDLLSNLARSVNASIDGFILNAVFRNLSITPTPTTNRGAVYLSVQPAPTQHPKIPTMPTPSVASLSPTTSTQPVVERIIQREVQTPLESQRPLTGQAQKIISIGGITQDYLDQRLASLNSDLTNRMLSLTNANSTTINNVYETLGMATRVEELTDTKLHTPTINGGTITGATISGGSVTATDFSGVLGVAKGGTATSGTPVYGQVLIGDGAGGYALMATSTLGIGAGSGLSSYDAFTHPVAGQSATTSLFLFNGNASSTQFSAYTAYFGATATSSFSTTGALTLSTALTITNGGTGTTTAPVSQLLYGGSSGAYQSVATSSPVAGTAISLSGSGALVGSALTINFAAPAGTGLSIPFASTTMISATTASSTNLWVSGITSGAILKTTTGGQVTAATAGSDYLASYDPFTHPAAGQSATTSLMIFSGAASSSLLSAYQAYFGGTATSTFTTSGQLGIGTSTPYSKLTLWGSDTSASTQSFLVANSASTTLFQVNNDGSAYSAGKFGIGTTSPWALLSVNPNALGSGVPEFVVGSSTATHLVVDGAGRVGIGTTTPWANLSINAGTGQNSFAIGSSTATYFLINSSGNVGIGSTTPWQLLSVNGTVAANAILPNGPYTNNLSVFDLGTTTARWNALWAGTLNIGTSTFSLKTDSSSNLGFFTAASGAGTQAMTLTSSGNVGIGTTSPAATLSTVGNEYMTGGLGVGVLNTTANTVNLASGGSYKIAGTSVLNGTTLGSGVTGSSLTSVGTIISGVWTGTTVAVANGGTGVTSSTGSGSVVLSSQPTFTTDLRTPFIYDSNDTNFYVDPNSTSVTNILYRTYGFNGAELDGNDGTYRVDPNGTTILSSVGMKTNSFPYSETLSISFPNTQAIHIDESSGSNSVNYQYFTKQGSNVGAIYYNGSVMAYQTTSDRRLKGNIATTTAGLETLLKIPVDDFNFLSNPGKRVQGFIAQDLYKYYPDAVQATDDGVSPLTATSSAWMIDYGRVTPLLAKAIQDLNLKLEDLATTTPDLDESSFPFRFFAALKDRLIAWFADATNGIKDFYASIIHAHEGKFSDKLCVGDTCVTPEQFQAVFGKDAAAQSSAAAAPVSSSPPSPSEPPVDEPTTDTASTTPSAAPAAANDTSQATTTDVITPTPEPALNLPTAANDSAPSEQLPASAVTP